MLADEPIVKNRHGGRVEGVQIGHALLHSVIPVLSTQQPLIKEQTMKKPINEEKIMQRRAVKLYFDDQDMDFNLNLP